MRMSALAAGDLLTLRRVLTATGLTLAWCALWGSFSVADVLSGAAVSVLALVVGVGGSGRGGIRLGSLLRFTALVAADMVASTVAVMREVLTPTDHTEEGIIAVPVPIECRHHLLLVYVAITVTPGTAVVAAESDGTVLYVHVLHSDRRHAVAAHIVRLAELANRALPTTGDVVRAKEDEVPS